MTRSALGLLAMLAACGASVPEIHHYTLGEREPASGAGGGSRARVKPTGVVEIADFESDAAYQDTRMAYRTGPVRLDYYDYHEWVAVPAVLVPDLVRTALEQTGRFRRVLRRPASGADLRLSGRILRFEEQDASPRAWEAVFVVALWVEDLASGEIVLDERFERRAAVDEQTPAGVALALSEAVQSVVAELVPDLARLASRARAADEELGGPEG
jgi:ABC-type uncharacterized transport system auxiliary subunit